ncbi:MAG: cyclic nucleotide-binding domain-containing protein [Burkholderiaceae bacterium]|nr:cyclic nucleotide-binding domain-containing protein [Sulfuritalea sp.]MCF8174753.1 cyclic nucleotide-binding domain-containing protein [Burkholderiaceae bacterium]MCF8184268.1 cyclic nucleotide-binding domain-containing protein [Polynucleobacter sp.]
MSSIDNIPNVEYLGDALPFVGRIREIIEVIKLFEDFEADELEGLARYMRCYRTPAGTEIIREGDDGDFMLLLLDGSVEIVKKDVRGSAQVMGSAGPGKTLGEMSLIDGAPRFASCVALDTVEIAVIDRDGLSRIIAEEPRIGVKLLMELLMLLNQRLRSISGQLMDCMEARRSRIR